MKTTNTAVGKMAKQIAAKFKGFDLKSPSEQMATYFAVGHDLQGVVMDEATYGPRVIADIASRVSHLRNEVYAYGVINLSDCDDAERAFIFEENATPMDNGLPLSPGHWRWVFRACSPARPADDEERFRRELAWIRRESPSEAFLEHVEQVLDREHEGELDDIRERVQRTISALDLV